MFLHLLLNDRWGREGTWRLRCSRVPSTSQGTLSSGPLTCPSRPKNPKPAFLHPDIQGQQVQTYPTKNVQDRHVRVRPGSLGGGQQVQPCRGSCCTTVQVSSSDENAKAFGFLLLSVQVMICTRRKRPTKKSPGFHLKLRPPPTPASKRSVSSLSLKRFHTLSTIKKTTNANPSVHWSRSKSRWNYY